MVVETPQLGHATYLFSKPRTMEEFLTVYITSTKEDIRQNRGNIAEKLRFLGRIAHGTNPRTWLKELKVRLEEPMDFELVATETHVCRMYDSGSLKSHKCLRG